MLISFGAENFYCFKEKIEIDFKLGPKVPSSVSGGKPYATAICLKGANASGKTNAVKILNFLSGFCSNSFNVKPDDKIPIESFFGNDDPIELFANFEIEDVIYFYELGIHNGGIAFEKIYKKDKRKTLVFHRVDATIKVNSFSSRKDLPLRRNASIISTLNQFEDLAIRPIYKFFNNVFTNVSVFGFQGGVLSNEFCSRFYFQNPEYLEFTKNLIKRFDTGIVDITISTYTDKDGNTAYAPIYHHETTEGPKTLTHASQSSGTKSLYNDLLIYGWVLKHGGVLALDEFDINLHPDILPPLIELFIDPNNNIENSQIIISTHNNEVIDVLGKYRTYLFNKHEGESFGYRLDEIESDLIRNDRPILPLYAAGKLGGTPRIDSKK